MGAHDRWVLWKGLWSLLFYLAAGKHSWFLSRKWHHLSRVTAAQANVSTLFPSRLSPQSVSQPLTWNSSFRKHFEDLVFHFTAVTQLLPSPVKSLLSSEFCKFLLVWHNKPNDVRMITEIQKGQRGKDLNGTGRELQSRFHQRCCHRSTTALKNIRDAYLVLSTLTSRHFYCMIHSMFKALIEFPAK